MTGDASAIVLDTAAGKAANE
jgi:hypothetical protein